MDVSNNDLQQEVVYLTEQAVHERNHEEYTDFYHTPGKGEGAITLNANDQNSYTLHAQRPKGLFENLTRFGGNIRGVHLKSARFKNKLPNINNSSAPYLVSTRSVFGPSKKLFLLKENVSRHYEKKKGKKIIHRYTVLLVLVNKNSPLYETLTGKRVELDIWKNEFMCLNTNLNSFSCAKNYIKSELTDLRTNIHIFHEGDVNLARMQPRAQEEDRVYHTKYTRISSANSNSQSNRTISPDFSVKEENDDYGSDNNNDDDSDDNDRFEEIKKKIKIETSQSESGNSHESMGGSFRNEAASAQPNYSSFFGSGIGIGIAQGLAQMLTTIFTGHNSSIKPPQINDNKPKTSIKLKLYNGEEHEVELNLDATIYVIFDYVTRLAPVNCTFRLTTGFPLKPLTNLNLTIREAELEGSRIIQELF